LGKTLACGCGAVAKLGKKRLNAALTDYVIIKNLVNNTAYIFKNLSILIEGLVEGGGIGNIKIISPRPVPLGINSVQSIGNYGVNISSKGVFGSSGVNLARSHVFDVFAKGNGHVFGSRIGRA
jgi:hypothetical protein